MQLPNEPQSGRAITVEWGRQVVRLLRALYPRPSPDVMPSVGAGGTTYALRESGAAGAATVAPAPEYGLDLYRSSYTGGGTAPDDQARRFRVRRGYCPLMPENIDGEFVVDASSTKTVYAEVGCSATGVPSTVSIQMADVMPATAAGTMDHAPPTTYIPLAIVTTDATQITEIVLQGRGSRDLAAIVRAEECGSNTIAYFYGAMEPDLTTDPYQSLLARIVALENPE